MSEIAIRTENLCKRYGEVSAVDNLSLSVPAGSVYAFLGPNGAGKSTTIRMLLGLAQPTGGVVEVLGQRVPRHPSRGMAKVGSLVEAPAIYGHLTGSENLQISRRLIGCERDSVDRVLETVGLTDVAGRKAGSYSLGMKQRLGLAQALLNEPRLLLLDEPSNGLDPAGMREVRDLIRCLARDQGITVFLCTHLLGEVEQVATDVAVIDGGRLCYQGSLSELENQAKSTLMVQCSDTERACCVLQDSGWSVQQEACGTLSIEAHSPSDAALINRTLVLADVAVWQVQLRVPDLEHVYMSLVENVMNPTVTRRVHIPAPALN